MLTKEQRREFVVDTMASWELEGMEPSPEALGRINAFVDGDLSLDDFIAAAKAATA